VSRSRARVGLVVSLLLPIAFLGAGLAVYSAGPAPAISPEPHGLPIMECGDGRWVALRTPGICYFSGGLPNEP